MIHKLDKKDKKILYQLDLDARQSFQQIGKRVRLSKEVVAYRIKRMERVGVIKSYYTLINMSKLGYFTNRFFIKLKNTDPQKEQEIINFFVKHKKYWWVDSIDGFRDLGVASWEKTIKDAQERREELLEKYKQNIKELDESIYSGFYIYKRAYLANKKQKDTRTINYITSEKESVDETDLKILKTISSNARISILEIADKINSTVNIVNYRLKKLKQQKIIEGFRARIDLSKIGYYWYKIEFDLKNISSKKQMLDYFARHPNIVYAYESTAKADLEVELEVESYEKFREILDEIRTKFKGQIESYQHLLWFKENKLLFFPQA